MTTAKPVLTGEQERLIWEIKRKTKRSWLQLRRGCHDLLGAGANHSTFAVGASSRTFARKACEELNADYATIIAWLDASSLGRE